MIANSQPWHVKNAAGSTNNYQSPVTAESLPRVPESNNLAITCLEMTNASQFRPSYLSYLDGIKVMCMYAPDLAFYRFLSNSVAMPQPNQRLVLSDQELKKLLAASGNSVHVLYVDGVPAGYIELVKRKDSPSSPFYSTEFVYFGLRSGYIGRSLDKHLLSHGIAYAWNNGTNRLWVRTSNIDSAKTLKNYLQRGFKIIRT